MEQANKHQRLDEIANEAELRELLLKPLFTKAGFGGVRITHGSLEDGKDIVFWEDSRIGRRKWTACVVKHGDVSGSASGKRSLGEVREQVTQAFEIPYPDPVGKSPVPIDQVFVVALGRISASARTKIVGTFRGKPVEFIDREDLAALIDQHWPEYWETRHPALQEYYAYVKNEIERFLDLKTLGCSSNRQFRDVFVDLLLEEKVRQRTRHRGRKTSKGGEPIAPKGERLKSSELLGRKGGRLLIGEGGSGKSCVIRNLALKQIVLNEARGGEGALPVMLHARELVSADVRDAIRSAAGRIASIEGLPIDLDDAMVEGKLLVLIDGYDEVSSQDDRGRVASRIEGFIASSPRSLLILASREINGFEFTSVLPNIKQYRVIPFSVPQVREFILNWFSDEAVRKKLEREVHESELLSVVPNTPLVLTMLAIVLEKQATKEIPANLADLFQMYSEMMLGKWDTEAHQLETLLDYNVSDRLLTEIASRMDASQSLEIDREVVVSAAEELLARVGLATNGPQVLASLDDRAGLLCETDGIVAFRHHSIQSFFSAKELVNEQVDENSIIDRFFDPWWAEAIFFYAGIRKDVPGLVVRAAGLPPSNANERFSKIALLGGISQAAYITKIEARKAAVREGASSAYELFRDVSSYAANNPDDPIAKLPRLVVLMICLELFSSNFGSRTLSNPLGGVWAECEEEGDEEHLFIRYAIARAEAIAGDPGHLIEVADRIPPGMVLWQLVAAIDLERLTDGRGSPAREAIVKVRRRIRSGRKQLAAEVERPIWRVLRDESS